MVENELREVARSQITKEELCSRIRDVTGGLRLEECHAVIHFGKIIMAHARGSREVKKKLLQ